MMVRIVCSVCLDMPQNTWQTKGMSAFRDPCTNEVAETDRTCRGFILSNCGRCSSNSLVVVRFQSHSLLDHLHRIPTDTFVDPVEAVPFPVDLGGRPPRQEKGVFCGRMQIKHGRVCFATCRCSILSRPPAIVAIPSIILTSLVVIVVAAAASIVVAIVPVPRSTA